jgi:hypothetical protein
MHQLRMRGSAMTTQTTFELPVEKMRQAVRGMLDLRVQRHGKIDCPESIEDLVDFCRKIYRDGRAHEREDNYGIANQN